MTGQQCAPWTTARLFLGARARDEQGNKLPTRGWTPDRPRATRRAVSCDGEDATWKTGVGYSRIGRDLVRGFISLLQHFRGASYSSTSSQPASAAGSIDRGRGWSGNIAHANGTRVRAPMTYVHTRACARARRERPRTIHENANDNWTASEAGISNFRAYRSHPTRGRAHRARTNTQRTDTSAVHVPTERRAPRRRRARTSLWRISRMHTTGTRRRRWGGTLLRNNPLARHKRWFNDRVIRQSDAPATTHREKESTHKSNVLRTSEIFRTRWHWEDLAIAATSNF